MEDAEQIRARRREWEEKYLQPCLDNFGLTENPNQFYTPADLPPDWNFLDKVGYPGEYPFVAGILPALPNITATRDGAGKAKNVRPKAGMYTGYGTAEDTRDYYLEDIRLGRSGGPWPAFDLPSQCGYDSDHPMARGEVGKTGVALDSLRDFEIMYEAFTGERDLDKIASNFTLTAPSNVAVAMYVALARQRGIALDKLHGIPDNDILREFTSRGTYIFPPGPSMRLIRDAMVYLIRNVPSFHINRITSYHTREAGATCSEAIAFTLCSAIAYAELGMKAGLSADDILQRFTFSGVGGSMNFFENICAARARRRVWAKITRERLGAKQPQSWVMAGQWHTLNAEATIGYSSATLQRPLNNIVRSTIGKMASVLSGGDPQGGGVQFDEPLELGHSREADQIELDAARIIQHEARMMDVIDPLAGSYYVEALTDRIETGIWEIIHKVDAMGGAVAAVEKGYVQQSIADSAYRQQRDLQAGKRLIVGVNAFTGDDELEIRIERHHPYLRQRKADAESRQLDSLAKLKRERDSGAVEASLRRLCEVAKDESANTIPAILEAVEVYATLGEICGVFRDVFGEYQSRR